MDLQNGIDSSAHIGAIKYSGNTIAVLGGGINNITVEKNIKLYNSIIQNNGLVISEHPKNIIPESKNFPIRNRIISGLSEIVIVVEAKYRSGSSITARYAKEQNKKVFCVPSNLGIKNGVGTNHLIAEGAKILTNVDDVLRELNIKTGINYEECEKTINPEYKELYDILTYMPMNLNDVIRLTKKEPYEIMQKIAMMELEGLVKSLPGGKIKKEG